MVAQARATADIQKPSIIWNSLGCILVGVIVFFIILYNIFRHCIKNAEQWLVRKKGLLQTQVFEAYYVSNVQLPDESWSHWSYTGRRQITNQDRDILSTSKRYRMVISVRYVFSSILNHVTSASPNKKFNLCCVIKFIWHWWDGNQVREQLLLNVQVLGLNSWWNLQDGGGLQPLESLSPTRIGPGEQKHSSKSRPVPSIEKYTWFDDVFLK